MLKIPKGFKMVIKEEWPKDIYVDPILIEEGMFKDVEDYKNFWDETIIPQLKKFLEDTKPKKQTQVMEGYAGTTPVIKKADFDLRGKIRIHFFDGRVLVLPIGRFPSIKKLSVAQRKQYTILNGIALNIHACSEIYHVQDFLGIPENYIYKG